MFGLIGIAATNLTATFALPAVASWAGRIGRSRTKPELPATDPASELRDRVRNTRLNLRASRRDGGARLIEIASVEIESEDTKSFYFKSLDNSALPSFRPGQHLIIERPAHGNRGVEFRCYSLSLAPSRKQWRLTIRRQSPIDTAASFSAWVHREWRVGDRLRIRGPKGNFVLDRSDAEKPIVFFSAGVGITPILSMLQEELSFPRKRSKWVFHQLRSLANAPLLSELIAEVEHSEACRAVVAVSQLDTKPKCTSRNVCLDSGKLRLNEIVSSIGTNDFYAFMCGPSPWMKDVRAALVKNGVPDSQVFDESFGGEDPSSQPPAGDHSKAVATNIATFQISYEATGKQTRFDDNETNLLSHAKGQGVSLPSGCRSGHCGTCAVKLLRGNVCYSREPAAELAENEILTCICKPTSDIAIQA